MTADLTLRFFSHIYIYISFLFFHYFFFLKKERLNVLVHYDTQERVDSCARVYMYFCSRYSGQLVFR